MMMDASFNFSVTAAELCFHEVADVSGERTGSYSFVTPEGSVVEVHYTAGTDGFVIVNPEDLPDSVPFSLCGPALHTVQEVEVEAQAAVTPCPPACLLSLPWQRCPVGCAWHGLSAPCCRPACPPKCARGPAGCSGPARECGLVPGCCPQPFSFVSGAGAHFRGGRGLG
jgi:hypothetical protein